LGVIGAIPADPSPKYGYLLPAADAVIGDPSEGIPIHKFTEKPDEETARQLIRQNALWNCGVFAFRVSIILNELRRNGWPDRYDGLRKAYHRLPQTSFDYQVAEKAESIIALPYEGKWKDLGTWTALTEEMDDTTLGNGIVTEHASDTHVVNELPVPAVVLGTRSLVVVCTPDGILVTDKSFSHRLKEMTDRLPRTPMYEEYRWGWRRVLEHAAHPTGGESWIQKLAIRAGHGFVRTSGRSSRAVWHILSGRGSFVLGGQSTPSEAGDLLVIPEHTMYGVSAAEDMEIVETIVGSDPRPGFCDSTNL
jgi:mannose-1-phosphate guanylyltransferase